MSMLANFCTGAKPGCLLAAFLCAALSLYSVRTVAEEPSSLSSELANEESENAIPTAPVVIDGATLFSVRGLPALPAESRAQRIADRILVLAEDKGFGVQTFKSEEVPAGTEILGGDHLVLLITDADSRLEGVNG